MPSLKILCTVTFCKPRYIIWNSCIPVSNQYLFSFLLSHLIPCI